MINYKKLANYQQYLLDSYRQKKGQPGYLQTFILLKNAILKNIYFLYTNLAPITKMTKVDLDVLVIGTCNTDIEKSKKCWDLLKNQGLKVEIIVDHKKRHLEILKTTKLPASYEVPSLFFLHYLYVLFLSFRYNPKVICLFHSNGVIPSLVRSLMPSAKTIYISHGVFPIEFFYSSFDFDYFFLFGEASLQNAQNTKKRFGNTKALLTGSPFIHEDFLRAHPLKCEKSVLFSANFLVKVPGIYQKSFFIFLDWIKSRPDITCYIKKHPIDEELFINNHARNIPNAIVMPTDTSLYNALQNVSFLINTDSCTSVEAALMGRPTIVLNHYDFDPTQTDNHLVSDNFLHLEKFFGPRAKNVDELNIKFEDFYKNHTHYEKKAKDFAQFHLSKKNSQLFISEFILNLVQNKPLNQYQFTNLEEKL